MRRPGMLPGTEIRAAALEVVDRCVAITGTDCAREIARMLRYASLHMALGEHLEASIRQMGSDGLLRGVDG